MTGAARTGGTRRGGPAGWLLELGLPLLVLAALNLYTVRFVAAERTLYRADQLAYWSYASELASGLRSSPASALAAVARSVPSQELNLLPALPMALVMALFGSSRLVYVLAVLDVYGLAVVLALVAALRWIRSDGASPPPLVRGIAVAAVLLLFPTLWRPVLIGYLGLGGVAIGIAIMALYLHGGFADNRPRHLLLAGFLVALLALYRRWFAIWGLAFVLAVVVDSCWHLGRSRRVGRGEVWRAVRAPLLVVAGMVGTLLLLAAPLLLNRLAPGYRQEFVAYARGGGLAARVGEVVAEFGLLPLAVVAASAAALLWVRSGRRPAVLLSLQALLAWLVMIRIQGHGPQHWYLYLPALLLLAALGLARILAPAGAWTAAAVPTSAALLLVGALGTAAVLAPGVVPLPAAVASLVSANRLRPLVRDDLDEVRRLLAYLDRLVAEKEGYIYVLGTGGLVSDHTLAFANRSLGTDFRSPSLILSSAHLDRRDGFPHGLLVAGYVVVPDPPQVDMAPEQQQVVLIPTRSFLEDEDVARAFRRLPEEFILDGDVHVWVWEKVRPITADEVAALGDRLRRAHPDLPGVWQP